MSGIRENQVEKVLLLRQKIDLQIQEMLEQASQNNSLDFFKFEVTNHNGTIQTDYQFRMRTRAY